MVSSDRLALYGALSVAAAAALHYFPLGLAVLGVIIVGVAVAKAYLEQRGQNG